MTKIRPINRTVLVEPIEEESKTKGGLLIPETGKRKPQKGRIFAIDEVVTKENPEFEEGATVIYGKNSGYELDIEGTTVLGMKDKEIYAIIFDKK